jgi:mannan endo-1,4-beta-mannosidase
MREKAFVIQGKKVPAIQKPMPPVLLPIEHVSAISWQGSTGASGYDIERSEKKGGPWRAVAYNVSDARYAYRPLFSDQSAVIGKQYYYRVKARNAAGVSKPSQIVGPVDVRTLSLVDEFENYAKLFYRSPKLTISRNEARRYKEDAHRLDGEAGEWVLYAVPGSIQQCQIYTFADSGDAQLKMSVSTDGKRFTDVETSLLDYAEGKGEYGYLHPVLYQVKNVADAPSFLRIDFTGKTSLSRVEIQYGE